THTHTHTRTHTHTYAPQFSTQHTASICSFITLPSRFSIHHMECAYNNSLFTHKLIPLPSSLSVFLSLSVYFCSPAHTVSYPSICLYLSLCVSLSLSPPFSAFMSLSLFHLSF